MGKKMPLYVDFSIRVCVVSPYVRMVASRTEPLESVTVRGADIETAPAETAESYMASRLSTSNATSVSY